MATSSTISNNLPPNSYFGLALNKLFSFTRAFFLATTSAALGLYFYLATLARPLSDDYCFSAWNLSVGPLIAGLYKYENTSNRFSNQFIVYISDLFGPRGVGILSAFTIILWVIALTYLLSEMSRSFRIRWNHWTGLLLAEVIALISLYSSANLFQSVFWRPGLMTYLLPLPLFTFVFAEILRSTRLAANRVETNVRPNLWMVAILFFAAFFIGGLSETAGALHITILGLSLVATFFWNKGTGRRTALGLISAALAGALLALVGMFLAPANAFRIEEGSAPTITQLIQRVLTFGIQFLSEAIRLLKQPGAFALGVGTLTGYTCVKFGGVDAPSTRKLIIAFIVVPILTYLLIIASFAPSAYGQSFPAERVRFPAHVLFVVSLLLEGALVGLFFARINFPRWVTALSILAMVVAALYPLWITRNNLPLIPQYKYRTEQWDERDARIRELAASGEKDIVVWQLPGIEGVKDLDARPVHWVNYCAAVYYGVDSIAAP